ncbi:hypothetical protein BD769DRAFT_1661748 [Suillus cothurnatus]|nr:hypothetical protein BD769DRAFT_1661748 [Suillus cothurnatus]
MRWRKRLLLGVLASNALALDATIGRGEYWQAMCWRWMQPEGGASIGKQCAGAGRNYREERVLASNALVLDATTGRSGHGSCDPFGPTPLQPMRSPSSDVPRSPSEASDESTPVPPPSSQLTVRSSGAPRQSHGKRRNTIAFGVGLSRPYTPSPAPLIKEEEDSEPLVASSPQTLVLLLRKPFMTTMELTTPL